MDRGDLIGRAAILEVNSGQGQVITFNINPLPRDLDRDDQQFLWTADHQILAARRAGDAGGSRLPK